MVCFWGGFCEFERVCFHTELMPKQFNKNDLQSEWENDPYLRELLSGPLYGFGIPNILPHTIWIWFN